MKRPRRLLLGLVLTVAAVVIVADLIARAITLDDRLPGVEQRLTDALGLPVTIGDGLRLSLLPRAHVDAFDVKVANLAGRPSPYLLEIRPVSRRSSGCIALISDDLPTPLWPASTVREWASVARSASTPSPVFAHTG